MGERRQAGFLANGHRFVEQVFDQLAGLAWGYAGKPSDLHAQPGTRVRQVGARFLANVVIQF